MLSEPQMLRYARHVLLREVGGRGQQRLLDARVGVSRLDADGRACALWLARAGIGALMLPAEDSPAPENDPAGLLLSTDAGRPLDEAVRERLRFHAPELRFVGECDRMIDPAGGARAALAVVRALVGAEGMEARG